jgi:single-stranded-DNA-specific exonuclease
VHPALAGKYVEKTGKPTIAIGRYGDRWVGSGRSTASYDITEAVKRAGEGILTHAGGHVQACGFSFPVDASKEMLFERLRADAATRLSLEDLIPILPIDAEIALSLVDWKFLDVLRMLEPYGEGNKRPTFVTRNVQVVSCEGMGKDLHHVRLVLRSAEGPAMKFVGFNFGDRIDELQVGMRVDVVYQVGLNEWNGRRDIQCSLMDVRSTKAE